MIYYRYTIQPKNRKKHEAFKKISYRIYKAFTLNYLSKAEQDKLLKTLECLIGLCATYYSYDDVDYLTLAVVHGYYMRIRFLINVL